MPHPGWLLHEHFVQVHPVLTSDDRRRCRGLHMVSHLAFATTRFPEIFLVWPNLLRYLCSTTLRRLRTRQHCRSLCSQKLDIMALGSASKLPSPAEPRYLGQSASTSRPTKRLVGGSDDNVKPWKRQTREKSSRTGSEESRTLQVAQEAWNVGQSHFAEIYKPVLPKAGKQKLFFKRDRNGQVTSILGKVFSWSGNIAHMDDEEIVSAVVTSVP